MHKPIRVLVVDDSAYVRLVVTRMLSAEPYLEVVGQAFNGEQALELADKLQPDVITLDVEMPKLNGLEVLRRLLPRNPIPVVMLSSLTRHGAQVTLEALSLGAVDFVAKPGSAGVPDLQAVHAQLISKVRAAAAAKVVPPPPPRRRPAPPPSPAPSPSLITGRTPVVLVAASTGGPGALHSLLAALPDALPAAFAITQHMPPSFTEALAQRLDGLCALSVKEADEGDFLRPGTALVARGGYHMIIGPRGAVHLSKDPPLWGVRPAADPMMISAAHSLRCPLVGVVLTGMGRDGAEGVKAIKQAGGTVIAESEQTAVIYGMPKAAYETGCCSAVLPLHDIADHIAGLVNNIVQLPTGA